MQIFHPKASVRILRALLGLGTLIVSWPLLESALLWLVRKAYHMEAGDTLNSLISGRSVHSLDYYLARGETLSSTSFLIAVGLLASAFLSMEAVPFQKEDDRRRKYRPVRLAVFLVSGAAVVVAVLTGRLHDYISYAQQWELLLNGDNPWANDSGNAYGPAYNLLAGIYWVDPLLPKLIFTILWSTCLVYLLRLTISNKLENSSIWIVFLAIGLNPLFLAHTVLYGNFDILVAAICLSAIILQARGRDAAAAICLTMAVLLKYYPLAMAPFLMIDGRKIKWKFSLTFLSTMAAGILASIAVWGLSTFQPLLFSAERESKLVSIFRVLRGNFSPLRIFTDAPNVDFLSYPLMLLSGGSIFLLSWFFRIGAIPSSILGLLTGLTMYQVGHPQFLQVVIVLLFYWYLRDNNNLTRQHKQLRASILAYALWLGVVSAIFVATGYNGGRFHDGMVGQWGFMRDLVGIPTFALSVWLIATILNTEIRNQQLAYLTSREGLRKLNQYDNA